MTSTLEMAATTAACIAGTVFDVEMDGDWVPVRIEMDDDWYLVGVPEDPAGRPDSPGGLVRVILSGGGEHEKGMGET